MTGDERPDPRARPARPTGPTQPARPGRREADQPVLPDVSRDETDVGWGDDPRERDADWYRRERPPHHGD